MRKVNLNIKLDERIHKEFKIWAIRNDTDLQSTIEGYITSLVVEQLDYVPEPKVKRKPPGRTPRHKLEELQHQES